MSIHIDAVSRQFGKFTALDRVSLSVSDGELVALLGPSGCGKTTLLRIIAGLDRPDQGILTIDDAAGTAPGPERRVGFVFQHYALFRHMTVFENVAFGLRVMPRRTRPPRAEIRDRVSALLALVQLEWTADRLPDQLSGGQRQRIALARALAIQPRVLLLDEPFGALDAQVRRELRRWLRRLHDELHVTSVFVTHDQEEALEVADRVVVMNNGRIEQVGTPRDIYDHPRSAFVYDFLGSSNRLAGFVHRGAVRVGESILMRDADPAHEGRPVSVFMRPEDIDVSPNRHEWPLLPGIVRDVITVGHRVRLTVEHGETGEHLDVELTRDRYAVHRVKPNERVFLSPRKMRYFV